LDELKKYVERKPEVLTKDGAFGETILHFALLKHRYIAAQWLINMNEKLREETYEAERYKGEGCLHIIIANENLKMALFLLDSYHKSDRRYTIGEIEGGILKDCYPLNHQRATGTFFRESGDDSVYYGETALDFAVSTNQTEMVDLLMGYSNPGIRGKGDFNGKWRARMDFTDSLHHNSVFHLCALKGHTNMWQVLVDHRLDTVAALSGLGREEVEVEFQVQRWVGTLLNAYGLTPLQVAACKNNKKMVEVILHQKRLLLWK